MGKIVISFIVFVLGLYYIFNHKPVTEGFDHTDPSPENFVARKLGLKKKYECPNVLVQKGNTLYLHNNKVAKVPGVNPLKFDNLEEYTEFIEWQRSQGINCPILYLRESYDAQGKRIYNVRPSPTNMQGGLQNLILTIPTKPNETKLLDSHRNDPPYNKNNYPGFDKENQYIGIKTPLDKMYHNNSAVSANPMDHNWGGKKYTQSLIDSGYYKDNEVRR